MLLHKIHVTSQTEANLPSPDAIRLPSSTQEPSVKTHASPVIRKEDHVEDDQLLDLQARVTTARLHDKPASILQAPRSPDSPSKEQQSYAALSAGSRDTSIPQPATFGAGSAGQTVRFNDVPELAKVSTISGEDLASNPRMSFRLSGRRATPHPMIRRSMHNKETEAAGCQA